MSVTYPEGFYASGFREGGAVSGRGLGVALLLNQGPQQLAVARFTGNRAQAHPIRWCRRLLSQGPVGPPPAFNSLVINSGNANCFTGPAGWQVVLETAARTAHLTGGEPEQVLICSTGIIGEPLPLPPLLLLLGRAHENILGQQGEDRQGEDRLVGGHAAANTILTTDSRSKEATYTSAAGWRIGGMAKGAGMLAPSLATMLVVLTTDALISARSTCGTQELSYEQLDSALGAVCARTFDRLDVDGCQSTNDQVTLLSSGASGLVADPEEFAAALHDVCASLAQQIIRDAEGAAHYVTVRTTGGTSEEEALAVSRAVARSSLVKTAIFGRDPNWGRILAAAGTASEATFDPDQVDILIDGVRVCHAGGPDRPRGEVAFATPEVLLEIRLRPEAADQNQGTADILTTDLTYKYVEENSAYSS